MGSERSSRHLTNYTEDPFPPWPWIHPWKQAACEAGDEKWRYLLHRDNTEFSEAGEQTVAFIAFICPHSKQITYSVSPNPNTLFPEFGCNGPQLKAVWRFMIFSWSFFILQNSYSYARNFSCTFLEAICSLWLTAQVTAEFSTNWTGHVLCLGPKFCAEDLEEDKTVVDQDAQRYLSDLCKSSWCCSEGETVRHGGGQEPWEREKAENLSYGSSPATNTPYIALVPYGWWDKRSLDGHPCTWKPDLFPHHSLQRLSVLTRVTLTSAFI